MLLLSDGHANRELGAHRPRREIVAKVAGRTCRDVSTTAFGLGLNFDQDLMGAIASPTSWRIATP